MSNEREVWIASALVADMSVDLFAWRLEQDWDRIGAGRLMFPAKDDQRPEYARTWLTLVDIGVTNLPTNEKGWPIGGAGRIQVTQRTLSSIVVRITGAEDLVRSGYGWLVAELGAVAQVDQTLADLEEAVESAAKQSRMSQGAVDAIGAAVMRLPEYLTLDLEVLAHRLGKKPGTIRNRMTRRP